MKKAIKWVVILLGALIALIIAALLIIPFFVDVQHYKPQIEKGVADATGRSFTLGGDLDLSLFPWAGLSLSDLHLGNAPGFQEKDFVAVDAFEVRVKLLPLLFKEVRVRRFVLDGCRIVLERHKDGRGNWEGLGKPSKEAEEKSPKDKAAPSKTEPSQGLPIKELMVGEFAITNASCLWIDHAKGERKEISDLNLRIQDVSLDRPVQLSLSANVLGKPLKVEGTLGPIGKEPGKGTMSVALSLAALKELKARLEGKVTDAAVKPSFDLHFDVSPFSPRKVMAALDQPFPVATADPKALNKVALKAKIAGDPAQVSVSEGVLELDESKMDLSLQAREFAKPNVTFDLNLDRIDLDRYLPPPGEETAETEKTAKTESGKPDYGPLRKLVLEGTIRIGMLTAKKAKVEDLALKVSARKGLFQINLMTPKLYQGNLFLKGAFDVRQDQPKSHMELDAKAIQAGPLLMDVLEKDFLEGTAKANMSLHMTGDDPEQIKKTLNGNGELLFADGAIKGIDLAGMVRNAKAAFGLAKKDAERPRTDFSELRAPFTITNGLVNTPGTSLASPLIRVVASGDANLVEEALDMRVEPKFVATLKGQGDSEQRTGLMVPVLVTGTFSAPKFRPDLKGMLKMDLKEGLPEPSKLKEMLPGQGEKGGESEPLEDKAKGAKGLLKGFSTGQ